MFNFNKEHGSLVAVAFTVFALLSVCIAILPALQMQNNNSPLPSQPEMTAQQLDGLKIFISEGCVACHTQQVRNIEMDNVWGSRPSMPSDYYYSKTRLSIWQQTPSILGSERTGPDLTNIGKRQPGAEWHLIHLYNPRIVVKQSIMPAYPWLFIKKTEVEKGDVMLPVPFAYHKDTSKVIVATEEALALVAYLQYLKQADLPDGTAITFIASSKKEKNQSQESKLIDGELLYKNTCSSCHQVDGTGLPGAFPPLAGSAIVNNNDFELMAKIILQGYDARSDYGVMPGFANQLTDEEIAAIMNHERSSWGNNAEPVTPENIKRIRDYVMSTAQ